MNIIDRYYIGINIGDIITVYSYDVLTKRYPNVVWNKSFFRKHCGNIFEVIKIENRGNHISYVCYAKNHESVIISCLAAKLIESKNYKKVAKDECNR